jgi:hypothetical protein
VLAAYAEESEDAPWQNEFNNPRVTRQWALTYEHPQHLWLLAEIRCIHPKLILVTLKCIIAGSRIEVLFFHIVVQGLRRPLNCESP